MLTTSRRVRDALISVADRVLPCRGRVSELGQELAEARAEAEEQWAKRQELAKATERALRAVKRELPRSAVLVEINRVEALLRAAS